MMKKEKSTKYVLGYDLGNKFSQISFLALNSSAPETLSLLAGKELFNIPTLLCRRSDCAQWFIGREAEKAVESDKSCIPVSDLLDKAISGEKIEVAETLYDPGALLTLFIKRSLSLLSMEMPVDDITAIMFTTDTISTDITEALKPVISGLCMNNCKMMLQTYEESLYYYMLYQPDNLWQGDVIACDYDFNRLTIYDMSYNRKTVPIVVTVEKAVTDELAANQQETMDSDAARREKLDYNDDILLERLKRICGSRTVSSAYLLGDGFKKKWYLKSLEYLCRNRHVFQGSNLFSKGASIAAKEKVNPGDMADRYVLLDSTKLKSNIAINVMNKGTETTRSMLDAGINWYDAGAETDIILEEGNTVELLSIPAANPVPERVNVELEGLIERPPFKTRLHIKLSLASVDTLHVFVKDMGFGEIYPSAGQTWEKDIKF